MHVFRFREFGLKTPIHAPKLTDRRCCVEMSLNLSDGKSVKSCVIYLTKKQYFGCLSNCRYCADRAQNLPGTTWITFGGVIAERVNTVFCPVEYFHDSPEAMLRFG